MAIRQWLPTSKPTKWEMILHGAQTCKRLIMRRCMSTSCIIIRRETGSSPTASFPGSCSQALLSVLAPSIMHANNLPHWWVYQSSQGSLQRGTCRNCEPRSWEARQCALRRHGPEAERWASAQSFIGTLTIVFRVRVGAPRFSRIVERAAAEAELGIEANADMLRHACGYKLANDGHDTQAIQAYLVHRNIQNTTRRLLSRRSGSKSFFGIEILSRRTDRAGSNNVMVCECGQSGIAQP